MAKPELGTKRVCPETGRKFYDLNKDPIVSPYTGKTYPLSFFEEPEAPVRMKAPKPKDATVDAVEDDEDEVAEDETADVVSLEEADDAVEDDKNLPDLGDNTDDEVEIDDDDDTFLPDDEEDDDDDMVGLIDIGGDDDEEI